MNEGMYNTIRTYLAEIASNQAQILAELRRTNELLARAPVVVYTDSPADVAQIADEVKAATKHKMTAKKKASA